MFFVAHLLKPIGYPYHCDDLSSIPALTIILVTTYRYPRLEKTKQKRLFTPT